MTRSYSSPIFAQAAAQWQEMREEFDLALRSHIDAAEQACRGSLLSPEGKAAGVSIDRLFGANRTTAARYASPELLEFWAARPRPTLAAFEEAWFEAQFASVA
ncbi:hypothetical protein [Cellulosimicrobium sp. Marseille-Q4280]|uniref:hypothetical protein n=1 Tax=Cellulosimicrobium sp. Marseille-Q4280 TaxID=2937992 RepID=UPI00203C97F1|nr:hypothetical protein [Cellulosimicrobium sp. Marseille-Q4280]